MIVIDATNLILGRFATFAAKQALLGKEVRIINCEKAIVSGAKARVIKDLRQRKERGTPAKGPFIPNIPDRYVRKVIRGMLPYKVAKGAEAFKRVMCYKGIPEEFKDAKVVKLEGTGVEKLPTLKYMTIGDALKYS